MDSDCGVADAEDMGDHARAGTPDASTAGTTSSRQDADAGDAASARVVEATARLIEHSCPYDECGIRLATALRATAPAASRGVTSVPVKCPRCQVRFGLWVPMNQAAYVGETAEWVAQPKA